MVRGGGGSTGGSGLMGILPPQPPELGGRDCVSIAVADTDAKEFGNECDKGELAVMETGIRLLSFARLRFHGLGG